MLIATAYGQLVNDPCETCRYEELRGEDLSIKPASEVSSIMRIHVSTSLAHPEPMMLELLGYGRMGGCLLSHDEGDWIKGTGYLFLAQKRLVLHLTGIHSPKRQHMSMAVGGG